MNKKGIALVTALAVAALAGCIGNDTGPIEVRGPDALRLGGDTEEVTVDVNGTASLRYEVEDLEDRTNFSLDVEAATEGNATAVVRVSILDDAGTVLANETLTVNGTAVKKTLNATFEAGKEIVVKVEAIEGSATVRLTAKDGDAELDEDRIAVEAEGQA